MVVVGSNVQILMEFRFCYGYFYIVGVVFNYDVDGFVFENLFIV